MVSIIHSKQFNSEKQKEHLSDSASCYTIAQFAQNHSGPLLIITPDSLQANRLEHELPFFLNSDFPVLSFPDWEILPYDLFSPHKDIISKRMEILSQIPTFSHGIIIICITTLLHRMVPRKYLTQHSLFLSLGQKIERTAFQNELTKAAYQRVNEVIQHGEYAIRGSILDLFPMGSDTPYRIEFFDDTIESIRSFNPETQRSLQKQNEIRLFPTHEFPLTHESIDLFCQQWENFFDSDPYECAIYQDILNGHYTAGAEYYLPLFFDKTASFFDYLPKNSSMIYTNDLTQTIKTFQKEISERYEQLRHDITRPILPPEKLFLSKDELFSTLNTFQTTQLQKITATTPLHNLKENFGDFLKTNACRILFCAETLGRQEIILKHLKPFSLTIKSVDNWKAFLNCRDTYCITLSSIETGFKIPDLNCIIIAETDLLGNRVQQRRQRKATPIQSIQTINHLAELHIDDPIVHLNHGVGRFLGLQSITIDQTTADYMVIRYADNDKLFVPITALHLISRYSSGNVELAPLHKLGTSQWENAKKKAFKRIRDVAAELLEIYARRQMHKGFAFQVDDLSYINFSDSFPFEETVDQQHAIDDVLKDMQSTKPMDRLICGDVGFGKTEVAIRAAFIAVQNSKQVAILVPTTLLAQQHYQTFIDRFGHWPINIETLSRLRTPKQQKNILTKLKEKKIDIIIGTHRLLQKDIQFHSLGLLIIDEEHRFGVTHKEKLKSLRLETDILTLTATPIPRTLNMAFSGIRDLSIIATPPKRRLSIKTLVIERKDSITREAILRELLRGGQIYFLHNKVQSIEQTVEKLKILIPEAKIEFAHGQMRERELEKVMSDFYHRRFNVLVCTTIIESGIDVPSANTILIERADKFGLAQLHQLRGRVGRSHHQAYAYLIAPSKKLLTKDAKKRLDSIEALEDLGIGFSLATHDMEIRGTGELFGKEQSGQMHEIGFTLYMQMLERMVKILKTGKLPEQDESMEPEIEIDLKISTIIPEIYIASPHTRLVLYKRIAHAIQQNELDDLRVEMIDRFGLLPEPTINLFEIASLKLKAKKLGIQKISCQEKMGTITFNKNPNINPNKIIQLIQQSLETYQLDKQQRLKFKLPEKIEERTNFIKQLLEKIK